MAQNVAEVELQDARRESRTSSIRFATQTTRAAVEAIVGAGNPYWNEISAELKKLPANERAAFVEAAKAAVESLGDYIENLED